MSNEEFYQAAREQSKVKAAIVSKYFRAWANVIISHLKKARRLSEKKIGYVDLFCGPGYYDDGTQSTPILVLELAIENADLRESLATIFNDSNPEFCALLQEAITKLGGLEHFHHRPQVTNQEVDAAFGSALQRLSLVPTLFFVDPWGYKGISLRLISGAIKDWGSECIMFFNLNRIRMHLGADRFAGRMAEIFGSERATALRAKVEGMSSADRELAIVEEMSDALEDAGAKFVLPFRFKDERGTRTSHYLIHATKHQLGYEIMKGIMAKQSSSSEQGVPSFEYSKADVRFPRLFELGRPLEDLKGMLLKRFSGETLTREEVYKKHNVGTPFIDKNYRDVLIQMEAEGMITADRPAEKHGKGSFGPNVRVTFPGEGE